MPPIFIKDISKYKDQPVKLRGWVYNFRSSGSIYFLEFRDGSGFIQIVVSKKEVDEESWQNCENLTIESSAIIEGTVAEHPKLTNVFEIRAKKIQLVQRAEEYPIGKKTHGPDFLLDYRHLWLRSPKQWAIQRIRNTIINATYDYLNAEGFIKIDAPILTPTSCEGTTTLFEIKYFDLGKAYLSQSGQLYIEAAIMSHGRVFDFGPTFRAEKSKTRRHLTEFWMMDAEMAFVEHQENMEIQEKLIGYIVRQVLEKCQEELKILERDIKSLEKIKPQFPKITYQEAIKKLQKKGSKIKFGDDFGGDEETLLATEFDQPLFIEKYPAKIKAFYMKRDSVNPELALNNDLLAPEGYGEIIGGSQREDDYQTLLKKLKEEKLPVKDFQWYLDLRRYGSVPHSGFGYGLERITAWLTGVKHIRETIPFPRTINRIRP